MRCGDIWRKISPAWRSARSSPASPDRTARISPSCCSKKATRCSASSARLSAPNDWRIDHLRDRVTLCPGDLLDQLSIIRLLDAAPARRVLQPRRDVVRAGVMGHAAADRRVQLAGRHARARCDPHRESEDQVLSGVVQRDVRQGARDSADRRHAVLSAQSLRRVEGVRALHHRELSRELRSVRRVRHSLQPRIAPPRPRVRDAQGHRRRRAHQAGPRRLACARQSRRAARLGLRRRLRPRDVADAPAADGGRLS